MNTASRSKYAARLVVQSCAVATGSGSLVVAVGWLCGKWSFAAFGEHYVPMAPSTAWLFIVISGAMMVQSRWLHRRVSGAIVGVAVGVIGLVGILILGHHWFPTLLDFEAHLASADVILGDIPVGRMSAHTAMAFLGAGGALGCLQLVLTSLRWWRPPAFIFALLVFGNGVVTGLRYASGVPLLYGSGHIPMALATALSFVVTGIGLMVAAYPDNWLLRGLTGDDKVDETDSRWFGPTVVLAFLICASGLSALGFVQLRRQVDEARLLAHEALSTVADLKAARIADWRRERFADANLVRRTPYAARRALDFLARPDSGATRGMFTSWLNGLRAVGPYARVLLLDEDLELRLVHPEHDGSEIGEATRRAMEQAFRTREVVMSDLDRATEEGNLYLSLAVPLVTRREKSGDKVPAAGVGPTASDISKAVLILQINADKDFSRFVNAWPTPSDTAEALLVRREGDEIAYLNRPRHVGRQPVHMRTPVSREEALVVRAILGSDDLLDGADYRDVPVLAARRAVEGTPWVLVAKVDRSEIYTPIRRQAQSDSIAIVSLVVGSALGLGLLWRQRVAALLRRQLVAEREQRTLAERIVYLTKHANDVILLSDENYRIIEANERALELYGYTAEEIRQLTLRDLCALGSQPDVELALYPAPSSEGEMFETIHRRRDGSTLPVEVSTRVIDVEGRRITQGIVRDISERKQAEETIQASLQEKETMLMEIHHRVKNNLQIIVSLLNLQAGRITDTVVLDALRSTQARIHSMALLHEMLYGSQNLAHVNIGDYIGKLCTHVRQSFGPVSGRIDLESRADGVQLELEQAVPCGLIVTELVSNAFKYAFPDDRSGRVLVELHPAGDRKIILRVSDDGVGLPDELDVSAGTSTLGLRLVAALADQLSGRLTTDTPTSDGATFRVEFVIPRGTIPRNES